MNIFKTLFKYLTGQQFTLYMDGGGGGQQNPVTQQTQIVELPEWAKGYAQDTLSKGQALTDINQNPYQAYTQPRIAEFSPLQRTAMSSVASPEAFGQSVQGYMSPYMQNVVDVQKRAAREQAGIQANTLAAKAAQSGAFGGSGFALQQAAQGRDLSRQLDEIQKMGSQAAYQQGVQQANTAIGQQTQLGALQQQQAQRPLDIAYQDFLAQKNYPYQQLSYMSNLIRGTPMGMNTQSQVYQGAPSALQTMGALGLGAYGLSKMGGFKEGGVVGYADGGMSIMDKFSDPEAMLPDMGKLNEDQLRAIIESPTTPAEREAAQRELAMRASETRGMASAYNQLPYDAQQRMVHAAGGGIVAFAGDDEENDPVGGQQVVSRGDPGMYRSALEEALGYGKKIGEFQPKGMTNAEYNKAISDRYALMERLGGASPYADFQKQLAERETERGKAREEAKGLAALQAIPAILQPGGTIRGLGAAAGSMGASFAKAAEADAAEKRAIQSMQFNLADAQRKERMGLGREAIAAADQARKDNADINRAHIEKLKAQALIAGRVAQAAKPTGTAAGAGAKLPQVDRQAAALSDQIESIKAENPSDPRLPLLQKQLEGRLKIISATKTSDVGPTRAGLMAGQTYAKASADVQKAVKAQALMDREWLDATAAGDADRQAAALDRLTEAHAKRSGVSAAGTAPRTGGAPPPPPGFNPVQ